jgi:hypothetical protein
MVGVFAFGRRSSGRRSGQSRNCSRSDRCRCERNPCAIGIARAAAATGNTPLLSTASSAHSTCAAAAASIRGRKNTGYQSVTTMHASRASVESRPLPAPAEGST